MEPESSLPQSQVPANCPYYPEPARSSPYYPNSTSWRSVLILSFHLRLGLPSALLPLDFPTKTLYTPLFSPLQATWPAHLILLDFITRTILGEEYRSLNSSLCSFLHSLVTSSLLGLNIFLNTLFSNTLSLRSSLNVSDQVSHPYKTIVKIIVLCILIFKYLNSKLEDKKFCTEWQRAFLDFSLLLISFWIEIWCIIYNKPTRCNSSSIVFINNYKYALHWNLFITNWCT